MTDTERTQEWLGVGGLGLDVSRWAAWGHAMATVEWCKAGGEPDMAEKWRGYARAMLRLGRERRSLHLWYRGARWGSPRGVV